MLKHFFIPLLYVTGLKKKKTCLAERIMMQGYWSIKLQILSVMKSIKGLFVCVCADMNNIHVWFSLMLGCQCARNSSSGIQTSLCRCSGWGNWRQVGSSQRYILGDRFHSTTNPHKSPLCNFHDINLCLQANALKTSYQEAENNRKNKKRLQSAFVQGFGTHFLFNFLMDFYQNEMIVHKQLLNLKKRLPEGFQVKRDKYMLFIYEPVEH